MVEVAERRCKCGTVMNKDYSESACFDGLGNVLPVPATAIFWSCHGCGSMLTERMGFYVDRGIVSGEDWHVPELKEEHEKSRQSLR